MLASRFSPASAGLLDEWTRGARKPGSGMQLALGPTLELIRQPLEDPEAVVAILDDVTPGGRRRNRWLQKQRGGAIGVDAERRPTLNGRPCCAALSERINTGLHLLRLPAQFTCEICGTVWEVRMQSREERPHGR